MPYTLRYFNAFTLTCLTLLALTACAVSQKQEQVIALTYREALQLTQQYEPQMNDEQRKRVKAAIVAYESAVQSFSGEADTSSLANMATALAAIQAVLSVYVNQEAEQ